MSKDYCIHGSHDLKTCRPCMRSSTEGNEDGELRMLEVGCRLATLGLAATVDLILRSNYPTTPTDRSSR